MVKLANGYTPRQLIEDLEQMVREEEMDLPMQMQADRLHYVQGFDVVNGHVRFY